MCGANFDDVKKVIAALVFVVTASIHANVLVPTRIPFEGKLRTAAGAPVTVVISLYESKDASTAIWTEEQSVTPDEDGSYVISIGATREEGIPANLFATAHARWIGVTVQGESEQPRIMLLSVPYAAKAREAETVGGKSVSDFVLAENFKEQIRAAMTGVDAAEQRSDGGRTVTGTRALLPPLSPQLRPDYIEGTAAGDFEHRGLSGIAVGVVGRARSTASGTLLSGVTGVLGEVSSSPAGTYSAAVRGVHFSTTGNGIGVVGYQDGSGWGVYGQTPQGIGVYGRVVGGSSLGGGVLGESLGTAPGVHAAYAGAGAGTALQIDNGAIQVSGVARAAFVHTMAEGNVTLDSTVIDNPLSNGDPNAILLVTPRHNPSAPSIVHTDYAVRYWIAGQRWEIWLPSTSTSSYLGAQFNVLIIKQ